MRITFVEPEAPGLNIWSKFRLPRLGPVLLGTILARAGHDVRVMFEQVRKLDWNRLQSSDLVGVSTITPTAPRAYALADKLSRLGVPVVMGGPHVTFLPDEAMRHARWVLRGEAEETIKPLLSAVECGGGFDQVPGLSWRQGDKVVHNPAASFVADLDALPFPDMSLLDGRMSSRVGLGKPAIPMQTSRGCPYNCSFCSVTGMFGRGYRFRSTESVIAELRSHDLTGRRVFFYDDNFAANPPRAKRLLETMIAEGITPDWSTQVHVDCARHAGLLPLMKRSGCRTLYVGLESINPGTLKSYRKAQTVETMERAVASIQRHGIDVHGMFVFGGELDDAETIRGTADWAKAQGLATVQFLLLTPLPGTRTFDDLDTEDRLLFRDWSLYDTHHVVFRPKLMSPHELQLEAHHAQAAFYSWRQVLRSIGKGDAINAMIRLYAHNLNGKWFRQNRAFFRRIQAFDA